ncbi:MAG: mevalonate kinase [Marinobacterium sp.]|nr:mevalonate kinase [Marinobacterium sp.]
MVHAISTIKVSVPGSIMLMGEHAVLFGHRALACAVDKYIHLWLETRSDGLVVIDSALAHYCAPLNDLADEPALSFVLAAIVQQQSALLSQQPGGFSVRIESEFSHTVGLGSSAAVTVATVAALRYLLQSGPDRALLLNEALSVVHQVQGRGSGTDLAASIYGGLIGYTVEPRQVKRLPGLPPIALYYAGYKTRTPDVLRKVEDSSRSQTALYAELYHLMHQTTAAAETAIEDQDWLELGKLMNIYQGLMDALGVCDATIADMIYRLRRAPDVVGSKISGSGLGDCVIALGAHQAPDMPYEAIAVAVSPAGVELTVMDTVSGASVSPE